MRTIGGLRYDDPRATPEYITRERARKRLANRDQWVRKNWPRIEAQVKGREEMKNNDCKSCEGTGFIGNLRCPYCGNGPGNPNG